MQYQTQTARFLIFCFCGLILAGLVFGGCGKKGPPVAPRLAPLVGVTDLQGRLEGRAAQLSWYHVPENAKAAGYIVLIAREELAEPQCPECPAVFRKVATILLNKSLADRRYELEYSHDVAPGYGYIFNVRPYFPSGAQGPDSNIVRVIFDEPQS